MPATSVSQSIWFIAAVSVALLVVGALTGVVSSLTDSVERRSDSMAGELDTEIEIINDPYAIPYDVANSTLTVYLKNVGAKKIPLAVSPINYSIVMFLTGSSAANAFTPVSITYIGIGGGGAPQEWVPGITIAVDFNVPGLLPNTDYRMEVTASSFKGVKDTLEFHIIPL